MRGAYGNQNLAFPTRSQYVTVDGSADESAALGSDTIAVSLYSTTDTWWNYTDKGADTPIAAKPGAEKTVVNSIFLPAGIMVDYPCPLGTDENPIKISCIQDSASGTLTIIERNDVNG